MSTEQINPGRGVRLLLVLLTGLVSGAVVAAAPVKESVPVGGRSMVNTVVADSVVAAGDDNPTAYLLNTIEQLRQEVMEIRGQLEEYSFRVNQLQQDGRDQYLDLDERISRLASQEISQRPAPVKAPASVKVPAAQEQSINQGEEAAYQKAFAHIRARQFNEARQALQEQLKIYPKGAYAANAHYWLGEVHMARGRYDDAKFSFERVLSDFPESQKVPDASYKLGRVYHLLGQPNKSREILQTVVRQYPQTTAASLSETYLGTLP